MAAFSGFLSELLAGKESFRSAGLGINHADIPRWE
jgi:hypothetical protein